MSLFWLRIEDNVLKFQVEDEPEHTVFIKLLPEQDLYKYLENYINIGYNNWKNKTKDSSISNS